MCNAENLLRSKRTLLLLFGAPGTGKGTFGSRIASEYGLLRLVTGDVLRAEIQKQTTLGSRLAEKVSQGLYIDDELICNIIRTKVSSSSICTILDGVPRTSAQAIFLRSLASSLGFRILGVNLTLDNEILTQRLLGRRHCAICNSNYNVCTINCGEYQMDAVLPSKNALEKCPGCHALKCRPDDERDTIKRRLSLYHENILDVFASLREVPIMNFGIKRGLRDYATFKERLEAFVLEHLT